MNSGTETATSGRSYRTDMGVLRALGRQSALEILFS
jgi:hypothetical protein